MSDWYQRAFPTRLSAQRQAVPEFETTAQGSRLATSVAGGADRAEHRHHRHRRSVEARGGLVANPAPGCQRVVQPHPLQPAQRQNFDGVVQSWGTANEASELSDFSVCNRRVEAAPAAGTAGHSLMFVKSSMSRAYSSGRKGPKWGLLQGTAVLQQYRPIADRRHQLCRSLLRPLLSELLVCLITCYHLTAPSRRRGPWADGVGAFGPA